MERWTGRFLSWLKMTRPKTKPRKQTPNPAIRSWLPGRPRKCTEAKSGSTRSFSLAKAEEGASSETIAARPLAAPIKSLRKKSDGCKLLKEWE
jgi:hypothetical protein